MLSLFATYGLQKEGSRLVECRICPHNCGAARTMGATGVCGADAGLNVASVVMHHGEEPVISGKNGICNVFFSCCNLRCIYCQNHQISDPSEAGYTGTMEFEEVMDCIIVALKGGSPNLGFVTPSHMVPQMLLLIRAVRSQGYDPVIVYNTNAYERAEEIDRLEDIVNVWLPDFKYSDPGLALKLSGAPDYPSIASDAIWRMYRQKGTTLRMEGDIAVSGLIIRHLVLPGHVANSIGVLREIERRIGTDVHISLMSQYHPNPSTAHDPVLGRTLYAEEYAQVVEEMDRLGFHRGWVQSLDSPANYQPDFGSGQPFGD